MYKKIVGILICIILMATNFLCGCIGISESVITGVWDHANTEATSVIFYGLIQDIRHFGDEYEGYIYYDNKFLTKIQLI